MQFDAFVGCGGRGGGQRGVKIRVGLGSTDGVTQYPFTNFRDVFLAFEGFLVGRGRGQDVQYGGEDEWNVVVVVVVVVSGGGGGGEMVMDGGQGGREKSNGGRCGGRGGSIEVQEEICLGMVEIGGAVRGEEKRDRSADGESFPFPLHDVF